MLSWLTAHREKFMPKKLVFCFPCLCSKGHAAELIYWTGNEGLSTKSQTLLWCWRLLFARNHRQDYGFGHEKRKHLTPAVTEHQHVSTTLIAVKESKVSSFLCSRGEKKHLYSWNHVQEKHSTTPYNLKAKCQTGDRIHTIFNASKHCKKSTLEKKWNCTVDIHTNQATLHANGGRGWQFQLDLINIFWLKRV